MKKVVSFAVLAVILFLSGCVGPTQMFTGPAVDMKLTRYPTEPLGNNEPFNVVVLLKNSLPREVEGELCVEDSVSDALGGIRKDCKSIILEKAQSSAAFTDVTEELVVFPNEDGYYSYAGIRPELYHNGNVIATLKFGVNSYASAELCVKKYDSSADCDDKEIIKKIQQEKLPVVVDKIEKTVSAFGSQARVSLRIYLKKAEDGDMIDSSLVAASSSELLEAQKIGFRADFMGREMICSGVIGGKTEFESNEKLIKCETSLNLNQDYLDGRAEVNLRYGFRMVDSSPSYELREEGYYA